MLDMSNISLSSKVGGTADPTAVSWAKRDNASRQGCSLEEHRIGRCLLKRLCIRWRDEPTCLLRGDFDVFDSTRGLRDRESVLTQPFDMEDDGFPYFIFNLGDGCPCCNAPRKVWHIGRVVALGFLDDDCVTHMTSRFETCLFQDTVQRTGREIVAGLSWNGNAANLARVLELTMTSTRRDQMPTIGLQQPEHFADLHDMRMAGAVARIRELMLVADLVLEKENPL